MNSIELKKNPFYILDADPVDNRRTIINKADEASFMIDQELAAEAQNILLTPAKRIIAEIEWFLFTSQDAVKKLKKNIEENSCIVTTDLVSIDLVNALLFNISVSNIFDIYEFGFQIAQIDEAFGNTNENAIYTRINELREKAGFSLCERNDVRNELRKKRELIKRIIAEKLGEINRDDLVEFATIIAEKYIAEPNYSNGAVIDDVIDSYEVEMQATIDEMTEIINCSIRDILQAKKAFIPQKIEELITSVRKWDAIVQPLQLVSSDSGIPHEVSVSVGTEIRSLCIKLHNELGMTKEALLLTKTMEEVFSEIPILAERFEDDSNELQRQIDENALSEELVPLLDGLKSAVENVKSYATDTNIKSMFDKARVLYDKLNSPQIDFELAGNLKDSVCLMIRDVSIDLHNNKSRTDDALRVMIFVQNVLKPNGQVGNQVRKDVVELTMQKEQKQRYERLVKEKEDRDKAKAIIWLVLIGLFILFAIIENL